MKDMSSAMETDKGNSQEEKIITQKMPVDELRSGMIISKDIVNKWGDILVHKGTEMDMSYYKRLKSSNIPHAEIVGDTIDLRKQLFSDTNSVYTNTTDVSSGSEETADKTADKTESKGGSIYSESEYIPIFETAEFKEFEASYENTTGEIKESLLAIGDGETIDLPKLYSLTNGIINNLNCKSDIFTYLNFIKVKDEHTFSHSNNVALLCNLFGSWIGLDEQQLMYLTTAGILHDLGKTKLDMNILNKKGKLTKEEFNHIKSHPVLGYQALVEQDIPHEIKLAALLHHEKIDGSGYPLGVTGDKISKFAKIVTICDIYDAMTANRVYRAKLSPFDVIKEFEQQSFGILDTEYLLIFLRHIAYTYIGRRIVLSDNNEAEIYFINAKNLSRPVVKTSEGIVIDLSSERNLNIQYLIS